MTPPPQIALFWLIAARSTFAKPRDWQSWADELILRLPKPPFWIIEMSLAKDLNTLQQALTEAFGNSPSGTSISFIDNTILGYIWWCFEDGRTSLAECLRLAGLQSDASCADIDCETFYALLNRLESASGDESKIRLEAEKLLLPFGQEAKRQWNEIQAAPLSVQHI